MRAHAVGRGQTNGDIPAFIVLDSVTTRDVEKYQAEKLKGLVARSR